MSHRHFDDDEDSAAYLMQPYEFANETFALNNLAIFDEYIELRIKGASSAVAFRISFGEEFVQDNNVTARIYAVEKNPYFKANFETKLQSTPIDKLWNPKLSVNMLLSIAVDKFAKDTARLSAIKELNILTNIVIIDENGKTKAGRGLADFYATEGELVEVASPVEVSDSDLPESTTETRH